MLRAVAMPPRRRSARAGATDAGAPSNPRPVPTAAGEKPRPRVQVVVLGDFGRSPRMQYHALSLADSLGADVDVVAYVGSEPRREVAVHPNIRMALIPPPPAWTNARRVPRIVALAVRVATQTAQMLWTTAVALPRPTHVLLQTPPCVPSFAVCWLVCLIRRAKFVIDWHNFAYTLMALKFGPSSPIVFIAKVYERMLGRLGHAHLAVTDAMATWLDERWGISDAVVLHDAPPEFFRPASVTETSALMRRLAPSLDASPAKVPGDCCDAILVGGGDPLTTTTGRGGARWREGRPALVVSSTSWTPDEDFGVLLDALTLYDEIAVADEDAMERYPDVLVVVTGKGPQRAHYESRMRSLRLKRVAVRTAWLESGDYPTLLGAADLGVCAHTSSSGLDLTDEGGGHVRMRVAGAGGEVRRDPRVGSRGRAVRGRERDGGRSRETAGGSPAQRRTAGKTTAHSGQGAKRVPVRFTRGARRAAVRGARGVRRGYQRGGGDAGEDAGRVGGEGRGEQVEG